MTDNEFLIELRLRRDALIFRAKPFLDDITSLEQTLAVIERLNVKGQNPASPGPGLCPAGGNIFTTAPPATPTVKGVQADLVRPARKNGMRVRTCMDAVLAAMRLRPKDTHTTDSLLEGAEKFYPGLCRKQVGRALHSLKVNGVVKVAGRGLFVLAVGPSLRADKPIAPSSKDSKEPEETATDLERQKQRLGIPSGAAVLADPDLLARKRQMEG